MLPIRSFSATRPDCMLRTLVLLATPFVSSPVSFPPAPNRLTVLYTTTTHVWVLLDSLPATAGTIYLYYGNPSANAGSTEGPFDNVAGLFAYWTLNETSGTGVGDSSGSSITGTATGTSIVAGQIANA